MADEFQCMLAGPRANALTVAGKLELFHPRVLRAGQGDVDEADGFVGVGAGSAGLGFTMPVMAMPSAAPVRDADALGYRARCTSGETGPLVAMSSAGTPSEGGFEGVAGNYRAAEEVTRAAGGRR